MNPPVVLSTVDAVMDDMFRVPLFVATTMSLPATPLPPAKQPGMSEAPSRHSVLRSPGPLSLTNGCKVVRSLSGVVLTALPSQ